MESLWPPGIHRADEVGPHLDAIIKAGAVGVKMSFETGFVAPVWRLHPPEVERAIVEEAGKRKLPIYVHAERAEMVRRALAVHPHALVHGPIDGTKELAAEIAAAKIPVVTTLALFDAPAIVLHPEQLEEPHIRRVVPALVLQSVRDPRQQPRRRRSACSPRSCRSSRAATATWLPGSPPPTPVFGRRTRRTGNWPLGHGDHSTAQGRRRAPGDGQRLRQLAPVSLLFPRSDVVAGAATAGRSRPVTAGGAPRGDRESRPDARTGGSTRHRGRRKDRRTSSSSATIRWWTSRRRCARCNTRSARAWLARPMNG